MRAAVFKSKDQPLAIETIQKPRPVKDQVLIRLHCAALNHRDIWLIREQTQSFPNGITLGSDGSGIVEAVGEDANPLLIGAEVIINPSHNWGTNPFVQGDSFKILGFPDNGTFSDYIVVPKQYVFEKPEHLSFVQAAALPLSGLTAYRALFSKARLRANEKVLITGIGGGAALWALNFATAYNARVYVFMGTEDIDAAIAIGLFRIYQEALVNIARHADAKNVITVFEISDHQASLSINDDGKGFDSSVKKKTLGLLGMKERAQMVGGMFTINSKPGKGTAVFITVPLLQKRNKPADTLAEK